MGINMYGFSYILDIDKILKNSMIIYIKKAK